MRTAHSLGEPVAGYSTACRASNPGFEGTFSVSLLSDSFPTYLNTPQKEQWFHACGVVSAHEFVLEW